MMENNWSALIIALFMLGAIFKFSSVIDEMQLSHGHNLTIKPVPASQIADDMTRQIEHMTQNLR